MGAGETRWWREMALAERQRWKDVHRVSISMGVECPCADCTHERWIEESRREWLTKLSELRRILGEHLRADPSSRRK